MLLFSRLVFVLFFCLFSLSFAQGKPSSFDVVVVGSEPEGIMAAVAAAESGASTLLITEDHKLGGLFVLGQMNSLDLRQDPFNYQQGLFLRWWQQVGKGHSFDIVQAERSFIKMLGEAGVSVRTSSASLRPLFSENNLVEGVIVENAEALETIWAKQTIDATANMDFATQAGASSSFGFSSLGFNARMADTLVFRIDNVNWAALSQGIKAKGRAYASVDKHVAWGHFDGYPAAYEAVEEGIRLRGLNLGRQDDGSILVNALLIYGINPFDPASLAEGRARATREAPRIINYLAQELPGFEQASFGGVAEALYIRETRHLNAECILTTDDVLNNHVTPLDIAAGGYPLDVQTLTPYDSGYVYGKPEIYGVQLCVSVPQGVENLWVVGKSAGYDPIAASSARVVPFGIAVAEAVGTAAAMSAKANLTMHGFISETRNILDLRTLLSMRGAYLPDVSARVPVGPYADPNYASYRLMLSHGLAVGGYSNDPSLSSPMSALSYVYLLSNVGQRFLKNNDLGKTIVSRYPDSEQRLTEAIALQITHEAACLVGVCVEPSWQALASAGIKHRGFVANEILTRGDMYTLAAGIAKLSSSLSQTE